MKNIRLRIVSLICVICFALSGNIAVFAANSKPEILINMDSTKKTADISIKNTGDMIYSAQITLKISGTANYALTCARDNMYGTVKNDGTDIILYTDSTDLLNGTDVIKLAKLTSNKAMTISNSADVILVDHSMRPQTYTNVKVTVKTASDAQSGSSGGGGGGSSSSGGNKGSGQIAGGNISVPNISDIADIIAGASSGGKRVFYDVAPDYWAKESIDYVTEKGLFDGMSENTFEPMQEMTRAMYVVVLNRFGTKIDSKWQIPCDSPAVFDDIPENDWFSEAVAWAGGIGLVNGVGDNCFAPYQPITREQMAVMTVNFANLCGVSLPSDGGAESFADETSINDWAVDAVYAARSAGIISGRDDNIFAPQDTATRAEVAAIMHRFAEILK